MGIRESLLNTITSVGNGDFIRIVTSAGASSKATLQNVIKSFETGLSAKTSLTTSDYIRVVGSDNVSYKQQVGNVADFIIENEYLTPPTALSSGADLLTLAVGVYYTPSNDVASSLVNKPSGLSRNCRVEVLSRIPARREIIVTDSANNVWENQMDSASTWTGWVQRPTRAEIDALNSKTIIKSRTNFTASASLAYTGISYTIPANSFYAINFNAVFLNNAPQEILISKSATTISPYLVYAHNDAGSIVSVSGTTMENLPLYVWARYNAATQNRIDIDGIVKSL